MPERNELYLVVGERDTDQHTYPYVMTKNADKANKALQYCKAKYTSYNWRIKIQKVTW